MTAPPKTANAVVLVQRDEHGNVTIRDANGKLRTCRQPADYAGALTAILDDTTLPELEDIHPADANVERAVVEYARELAPAPLRPFVAVGVQRLKTFLQGFSSPRKRKSRTSRRRGSAPRGRPRPNRGRAA